MTFKMMMTQVQKYNHLGTAKAAATHCKKIQAILHGDDGLYWMTSPAMAAKLEKQGYEIICYAF